MAFWGGAWRGTAAAVGRAEGSRGLFGCPNTINVMDVQKNIQIKTHFSKFMIVKSFVLHIRKWAERSRTHSLLYPTPCLPPPPQGGQKNAATLGVGGGVDRGRRGAQTVGGNKAP